MRKCTLYLTATTPLVNVSSLVLPLATSLCIPLMKFLVQVWNSLASKRIPLRLPLLLSVADVLKWTELLKLNSTEFGTTALRLTTVWVPLAPVLTRTPPSPALPRAMCSGMELLVSLLTTWEHRLLRVRKKLTLGP